MAVSNPIVNADDSFGALRTLFRRLTHFLAYHFVLTRNHTTTTYVAGLDLLVQPTVFHPKIFITSKFFAEFLQSLDLAGKNVADVGTGSGILALSAAKAGAASVLALDINPAAVKTAAANAIRNNLRQVSALESNLLSAIPPDRTFDVIISSPPSFSGEPRNVADRAWHAGRGYCDIADLFAQTAAHLKPEGKMYLLVSSDTNWPLFKALIKDAGLTPKRIGLKSILVEEFPIYELHKNDAAPAAVAAQ